MAKLAVKCVILIFFLYYYECSPRPTYTSKYDDINLDEVLASERLLTGYVNCLLDLGPCTSDAKELKKNLPDAISNDCKSCTERQRDGADKVMQHLIDNRADDWEKLEIRYKSDGSYKQNYLRQKESEEKATQDYKTLNETQNNNVESV